MHVFNKCSHTYSYVASNKNYIINTNTTNFINQLSKIEREKHSHTVLYSYKTASKLSELLNKSHQEKGYGNQNKATSRMNCRHITRGVWISNATTLLRYTHTTDIVMSLINSCC